MHIIAHKNKNAPIDHIAPPPVLLSIDRPAPNRYDLGLDRPLQQRWAGRKGANGVSFGKGTREVGSPFHVKAIGPGPARYKVDQEIGMPDPFLKRAERSTSKVLAVAGVWFSIMAIFAVVPPMS